MEPQAVHMLIEPAWEISLHWFIRVGLGSAGGCTQPRLPVAFLHHPLLKVLELSLTYSVICSGPLCSYSQEGGSAAQFKT